MATVMPIVDLVFEGLDEVEVGVDHSGPLCEDDGGIVDEKLKSSVFNASALVSDSAFKKSLLEGPSEVIPGLFVGSANDVEIVKNLGIKNVLNLAASTDSEINGRNMRLLSVHAEDRNGYSLLSQHYTECKEFIRRGLRDGGVLVHCHAGVNRSVAIVAAYLLEEEKYPLSRVLVLLKEKRGMILTNTGFITQLVNHAMSLNLLDL